MKYLCLVYLDEDRLNELPDAECVAYDAAIRDSGHCLASEALQSVQTATTVRVRDGRLSITDGPFAETKEQLTGFYLIDAKDLVLTHTTSRVTLTSGPLTVFDANGSALRSVPRA